MKQKLFVVGFFLFPVLTLIFGCGDLYVKPSDNSIVIKKENIFSKINENNRTIIFIYF